MKYQRGTSQDGHFCMTSNTPSFYQLNTPLSRYDKFLDSGAISKVRSHLSVFLSMWFLGG